MLWPVAQEPYGYVWFDQNTEHRFTRSNPVPNYFAHDVNPVFTSPPDYEALKADNSKLHAAIQRKVTDLAFVERWANHHSVKPRNTAQEALSCIQHYPSILEITKSYKDGVVPTTRNPYAENEALRQRVAELEAATEHFGLTPQQAKDGLTRYKALVSERDRLQSECDKATDLITAVYRHGVHPSINDGSDVRLTERLGIFLGCNKVEPAK